MATPQMTAPLQPGGLLARRYRLIDNIGAGGMSVIWRARDEVLDRVVAVKVLAPSLAADAKFRDMVREEARAAAEDFGRRHDATIRRRRECATCSARFTTYERVEAARLLVVKRDGARQDFDREKLRAGLLKALQKRPVTLDRVETAVEEIEVAGIGTGAVGPARRVLADQQRDQMVAQVAGDGQLTAGELAG